MKQGPDLILHAEQAAYLDRTVPARDPLLARMEAFAAAHDHPISDPEVGNLLTAVTRMRAPRSRFTSQRSTAGWPRCRAWRPML